MISGKVCRHISASGYQETDKLVYQTPKMHRNQDYSMVPIVDILTRARSHIIFQVRIMKDWGRLELPRVSGSTSDAGRPGGGFSFSQLLSFSSCCISASFGAPEGAWSGAGSHRPFKAGYPATWAIFPRHARLTFTPMVGRKMGKKLGENGGEWGKMGFLRHLGPPVGVVGVGIAPPF